MKYVKFTDKQTGKPLWLREDQVLGWFPEKAHYRVTPAFDEVDVEVRESGEQILAIMEGRRNEVTPLTEATKNDTMLPKGGNQDEHANHRPRRPIRPADSSQ